MYVVFLKLLVIAFTRLIDINNINNRSVEGCLEMIVLKVLR